MITKITALEPLAAIPYLDTSNLDRRFVSTLSFFDERWRMWVVAGEDDLQQVVEIHAVPVEAFYFAKTPEDAKDLYFYFLILWPSAGIV